MNDEYLWDKKGDDPGIRSLENALSEFRMRPGSAPAIPPAAPAVVETKRRGFFRLRLAFAAVCVVTAAVALAGLIALRDSSPVATETTPVQTETQSRTTTEVVRSDPSEPQEKASPVVRPRKPARPRMVKTVYFKKQKANNGSETGDRPLLDESQLTAEERQAYEKLMLALSITSSKLKIVKDKLNGGGE